MNEEVSWGVGDFLTIGVLLLGAVLAYLFLAKRVKDVKKRIALVAVIVIVLLLVWAELAVGVFGTPFAGN